MPWLTLGILCRTIQLTNNSCYGSAVTPFGLLLRDIRVRHGLRQADLAEVMGYDQTYWSALELGTKGPPPNSFVTSMKTKLDLADDDAFALLQAIDDSCRHFTIPTAASPSVFLVLNKLRRQLETLHPAQLALIEQALDLQGELKHSDKLHQPQRVHRKVGLSPRKEMGMT